MRKLSFAVPGILLSLSLLLASCQPAALAAPQLVEDAKEKIPIYWYSGLGAGSVPAQVPLEKAFVEKYNASQDEIQLISIIVDHKYARDNLTTQITSGNPPDIVGPIGTTGRMAFPGAFLDLSPLVKEFAYDTGDIDPAFLDFYKDEGKLVGLPFAIYPEFMYVNKDLFQQAGLALPPQKYGEKYKMPNGKQVEWDFDTLAAIGKILTLDKNGRNATKARFDARNIVQYGYVPQWTDHPRAIGSLFGAFDMIDTATQRATWPESATAALKWYHDGMWGRQPFIPNKAAIESDLMRANAFSSGKVAMATSHLWYTCCIDTANVPNWDAAVMPSYNGKVTSKMHGDTFAIMSASRHPKEAFKVYSYMLGTGASDLYQIYGGLPARKDSQRAFFDDLDKNFAPNQVNWQVVIDSIPYMDVPNHENVLVPNFSEIWDIGSELTSKLQTEENIADMQALVDDYVEQWTDSINQAAQ